MPLRVQISPGAPAPIYRQIAEQIRSAVACGQIQVGDPLPSVRALAEELAINPNTVSQAYRELARDGITQTLAGRGIVVAQRQQILALSERRRRLDRAIQTFINEIAFLDLSRDEILNRLGAQLDRLAEGKRSQEQK